ncbi:hypothetical protein [Streptomyces tritici]
MSRHDGEHSLTFEAGGTTVAEEDLPDVLGAAFGRNPDGTTIGHPHAAL